MALLRQIGSRYQINKFVETGTFRGDTAARASEIYGIVVTIENSRALHAAATARHRGSRNIEFLFGHSSQMLKEVVAKAQEPCVFWLDAHWSGGETYGHRDECPLLDEIAAINESPYEHFILIDDARLFLAPPPRPHDASAWPTISELVEILKKKARYTAIHGDVVISVPDHAKSAVIDYCRDEAEREWACESSRIYRGLRELTARMKKILCGRADGKH